MREDGHVLNLAFGGKRINIAWVCKIINKILYSPIHNSQVLYLSEFSGIAGDKSYTETKCMSAEMQVVVSSINFIKDPLSSEVWAVSSQT